MSTLRKWTVDETCDVKGIKLEKKPTFFAVVLFCSSYPPPPHPQLSQHLPFHFSLSLSSLWVARTTPHWPLPAVRDLTRDGRLSTGTYGESVLKLSKVIFRGKMRTHETPYIQLPSSTQLAWLGHFPLASQAGRLADPVLYTIFFLWQEQP
jgi:hypothetical protein